MLHAPDFLGFEDVLELAKDHSAVVQQALKMKKIGTNLLLCSVEEKFTRSM